MTRAALTIGRSDCRKGDRRCWRGWPDGGDSATIFLRLTMPQQCADSVEYCIESTHHICCDCCAQVP